MKNLINNKLFKRIYQKITGYHYNLSYSQTGEDIIIEFLINAKQIKNFTYLDIGANHPIKLNNTFKFYESGHKGVCIEPDPTVFKKLKSVRNKDICLNIGIASKEESSANLYVMSNSVLNTFSKEEAEALEMNKHDTIKKIIPIPLKTVTQIIEEHFASKAPIFINLDVEGLDEEILRSFPFERYRPYIFCIETIHFTNDASSEKRLEIMEIMKSNNYKPFADTYINTIFIDNE